MTIRNSSKRTAISIRRAATMIEVGFASVCIVSLLGMIVGAGDRHRDYSQAGVCSDHLREISQGFDSYLASTAGEYPPSYVFPYNSDGWF